MTSPAAPTADGNPTPPDHAIDYVLGADELELDRLGVQHRLWADVAHAVWRRAGVVPGSRVLDIGCGPGFAALDLAEWVGQHGRVVGVDESAYFVERFRERAASLVVPNARAIKGDVQRLGAALAELPEAADGFDVGYARWVLCFVADPAAVLAGAAAALRPGGRLCLHDYFNYEGSFTVSPQDHRMERVTAAVAQSWRDRGGNPDVMGLMPKLLDQAGFELVHFEVHQRLARPGTAMWSWPDTFWPSVIPRLVASGHLTTADQTAFEIMWAELSASATSFMMPPPVFEAIAIKR